MRRPAREPNRFHRTREVHFSSRLRKVLPFVLAVSIGAAYAHVPESLRESRPSPRRRGFVEMVEESSHLHQKRAHIKGLRNSQRNFRNVSRWVGTQERLRRPVDAAMLARARYPAARRFPLPRRAPPRLERGPRG